MTEHYDIIVIGGGHNGLVAAATLAQAGKRVLVVERRDTLGGAAATEEIFPGFRVDTGATDAALFQDEIIRKLDLTRYGLAFRENPALLFAPQADGRALTIWRDEARSVADIARFSERDAARWPAFRRQVERMTGLLRGMLLLAPPDLAGLRGGDVMGWAPLALRLRRLGGDDMMELFRLLPMAAQAYLDEWFESDALKGALGGSAVVGATLGPRSAGTNLTFFYQNLGGLLNHRFVVGGMGQLSAALRGPPGPPSAPARAWPRFSSVTVSTRRPSACGWTRARRFGPRPCCPTPTRATRYSNSSGRNSWSRKSCATCATSCSGAAQRGSIWCSAGCRRSSGWPTMPNSAGASGWPPASMPSSGHTTPPNTAASPRSPTWRCICRRSTSRRRAAMS
jgi:hypothetical protein